MFQFEFESNNVVESKESIIQPTKLYAVEQLLECLPETISYAMCNGIPRREWWDVKHQLMSDDSFSSDEKDILLGTNDLLTNRYEGGLKTWECALDLVTYIRDQPCPANVLELGCGAALPSMACLLNCLRQPDKSGAKRSFMLADFNESVLKLVTMPNLLLTCISAEGPNLMDDVGSICVADECTRLLDILERHSIQVTFLSGSWSEDMARLLSNTYELILASETIYSMSSLQPFTKLVCDAMAPTGKAVIASKQIYFGVGGGVAEFASCAERHGLLCRRVKSTSNGISRVILESTFCGHPN